MNKIISDLFKLVVDFIAEETTTLEKIQNLITVITLYTSGKTDELLDFLNSKNPKEDFEGEIPFSSIREQIDNFVAIAEKKGITLYYSNNDSRVDEDIFNYLPNAQVSPEKAQQGTFTFVDTVNGTTEEKMLETAQKMSLSQAIAYFTDELEKGTFDTTETYRIIFLDDENLRDSDGKSLRLFCNRNSDGKLRLIVSEVSPGNSWSDAGIAWLATES